MTPPLLLRPLSAGEAALVGELATGATVGAAGARLGISYHTAANRLVAVGLKLTGAGGPLERVRAWHAAGCPAAPDEAAA